MADAPNYDDIWQDAGNETGLDPLLLKAKDYVESGHDRFAVSPANAKGIAQLEPAAASEVGVTDFYDPKQSIHGGARYLRRQFDAFKGDPYTALAAYNAGPHGDFSNPETTEYVNKVASKWDEYRAQKWAKQGKQQQALSFDDLPDASAAKPLSFDDLPDAKPGQVTLPLAKRDEAPPAPPTPQQNLARNKPYVAASARQFTTALPPDQEAQFRKWVTDQKIPVNPDDKTPDYDMRGYWQTANTPGAWKHLQDMNQIPADMTPGGTKVDPNDGQPHFPDWWKTPYHQTFSNESQFADRSTAPHWTHDDKLVAPDGKVVFDDRAQQQKPAAEEPGYLHSALLGGTGGLRDVVTGAQQTAAMVKTGKPSAAPEQADEEKALGAPISWATTPSTMGVKKAIYQSARGLTGSAPEMGGAVLGGLAGAAAGAETGPGALLTGAAGAGLGAGFVSAAREFAPIYREELDRLGPGKEDEAFNTALKRGATQAGGTALSFALFEGLPLAPFLKNIFVGGRSMEASAIASGLTKTADGAWIAPAGSMAKQLPVQGAIAAGQTAATNIEDGRPAAENIGNAAIMTGVGIAAPAIAHGVLSRATGTQRGPPSGNPESETTPPPGQQGAGQTPVSPTGGRPAGPGITDPILPDNYASHIAPTGTGPEGPGLTPGPTPGPTPPPVTPPAPDPLEQAHKTLSDITAGVDPKQGTPATPAPTPAPETQAGPPDPTPPGPAPGQVPPPHPEPPAPPPAPIVPPVESTPAAPSTSGHPNDSPPKSGDYVMLDPAQLNVDPARFQFKASDSEKGVTGVLRGSDRWEATLADPITAWQDNDGKYWVANGHQRTDLANRAVAAGQQDVQVPAKIYREADGYTAGQMRALGAFQNIAQGSGTAIDAAKILREVGKAPTDYQLPTLPPKSALTIQARGLAKLSDEAFGAVVNDVVPSAYAAHVGDMITDPAQQIAAIGMLAKGHPANADQARMMVQDIRNSGFLQDTQSTLFGDEAFSKSLFPERAKVLDGALKTLRGNKTVYRAAVTGEDALTAAGNKMDSQGNLKAKSENDQLIDHLERNATTKGPLSDALTAAATDLAAGKPATNAIAGFLRAARQDHASGREVGVERGVEAERDQPPPEADHAGPIEDPGQSGLLAPKGRITDRGQSDMFGADQKPRTEVTPPKPKAQQLDMFGRNDAAIQAQAKRDQEGRGALMGKGDQQKADHGLFADRQEGQGNLIDKPAERPQQSEMGGAPAVWDTDTRSPAPGRDLTSKVIVRPGESGQTAAGRFVTTLGKFSGNEYLTAVENGSGRVIHAATNDQKGQVAVPDMTGRPNDSITVHHNHPGGMGFSMEDLRLLHHPQMSHILAHADDGDSFAAGIGDRHRGERNPMGGPVRSKLMQEHQIAESHTRAIIAEFFRTLPPDKALAQGDATMTMLNKAFYDVIARIMHADGHIDYISTRALDPTIERLLVDHLERAGYNPREIAGATRAYKHDEIAAALPRPMEGLHAAKADLEPDRPASAVRPGSGPEGIPGAIRGAGERPGRQRDSRGAEGASADRRPVLGTVAPEGSARSGTTTPVTPPPQGLIDRFLSKARDLFENGRTKLNEAMTAHFTPLAGGTKRAMAIAVDFANALRGVNYQFKLLDDRIKKDFPDARHREAMGKAMDQTSVLEQMISEMRTNNAAQGTLGQPMMSAAQVAHAEATMRQTWTAQGKGIETLPPDQRALVDQLGRLGDQVWQRMKGRGMVDASAEGLPYYFARMVLQRDASGNIIKPAKGGTGRDIHDFGGNLTSSGPMTRKHLTPEDTLAAAQAALQDPNAFIVNDIRVVAQALNRNERAIAGRDFIDAIKRIGVANGINTILHGAIPHGSNPADYFTIDGHPSFRQWTGSGFQAIHVSKEFEGPIKAVLTQPGSALYQGAMKAKGASMTAIMWSPLMHLGVEIGRAFPLMPGRILTGKVFGDGNRLRRDAGYMQRATDDGLAPIGQSWREDAASIAEQADVNRKPPGLFGKVGEAFHDLHQKVLWDNVFKLQVGIYDNLRTEFMNKGFDQKVAGVMAAHEANRFAGALPSENLSRWANQTANLLLFSRSFTLGNLGVMKDMFNGMPRQTRAVIEQYAGPQVAKDAAKVLQRKAMGAVVFDIGMMYMANTVLQEGAAVWGRAPTMGLGPAAQSVLDDWKDQASAALSATAKDWNPMHLLGVLPQHNNEPGKTNRAYVGKDEEGRGIYARLSFGKVGEEFLSWPFSPAQLLENKLSPWIRPLIEDLFGEDTLGRKIYNPHPASFGDFLANAGRAVTHVAGSLGPVDQAKGAWQLGKQVTGHGDKSADWLTPAVRAGLPMTGLGQISSGFPGGPEAGFDYAHKQTAEFYRQKASPVARQQVKDGDPEGAYQTLKDAGVDFKTARLMVRRMGQSSAAAAGERYAARHETETQREQRAHLTGATKP